MWAGYMHEHMTRVKRLPAGARMGVPHLPGAANRLHAICKERNWLKCAPSALIAKALPARNLFGVLKHEFGNVVCGGKQAAAWAVPSLLPDWRELAIRISAAREPFLRCKHEGRVVLQWSGMNAFNLQARAVVHGAGSAWCMVHTRYDSVAAPAHRATRMQRHDKDSQMSRRSNRKGTAARTRSVWCGWIQTPACSRHPCVQPHSRQTTPCHASSVKFKCRVHGRGHRTMSAASSLNVEFMPSGAVNSSCSHSSNDLAPSPSPSSPKCRLAACANARPRSAKPRLE